MNLETYIKSLFNNLSKPYCVVDSSTTKIVDINIPMVFVLKSLMSINIKNNEVLREFAKVSFVFNNKTYDIFTIKDNIKIKKFGNQYKLLSVQEPMSPTDFFNKYITT